MKKTFTEKSIFLVAFIEGAAVMAIEISGVKLITPYFGSTLYVWASVLSVTLGGLALGYFLGGFISSRFSGKTTVPIILLTGALLTLLMPFLVSLLIPYTMELGLRVGSLTTTLFFLMPPLICMGMISPILIQFGTRELNKAGKMAGSIYSISTVGGIIMTLLIGFYLLPEWGIRKSLWLTSALLVAATIIFAVVFRSRKTVVSILILLIPLIATELLPFFHSKPHSAVEVIHESESIMGTVKVIDLTDINDEQFRALRINGVNQTMMLKNNPPYSAWIYAHRLATLSSIKPEGSKVLLIGLAGGNLAMELKVLGFRVDVIDIDPRMPEIAEEFFGFVPDGMNIYIDDGRHFLNTTPEVYDIVILDVLTGEVQPQHLFTTEAIQHLKKVTAPDALIFINFQGYLEGAKGIAARSVCRTLQNSNYKIQYHRKSDDENYKGDILIIASLTEQDFNNINYLRLNICCQLFGFQHNDLISKKKVDFSDGHLLTDDKPLFDWINRHYMEERRTRRMEGMQKEFSFF